MALTRVEGCFREQTPGDGQQIIDLAQGRFGVQVANADGSNGSFVCGAAAFGPNSAIRFEPRLLREAFEDAPQFGSGQAIARKAPLLDPGRSG